MAFILAKESIFHSRFTKFTGFPLKFRLLSYFQKSNLISTYCENLNFRKQFGNHRVVEFRYRKFPFQACCCVSTFIHPTKLCWEGSSYDVLSTKLETALKDHRIDEAWELFNDFKRLYGFPNDNVLLMLVCQMSYTSDHSWLQRACNLVLQIWKEKPVILQLEALTKLSLALARSQMPIPVSVILRLMLEMKRLPNIKMSQLVILHMVKTDIGAYLASNILVQICDCFLQPVVNRNDQVKLVKLDTVIFNLVLDACVRFKLNLKGHQLMELMSQNGVVADAHTIVLIARIHDMNGQRDDLKKFKIHIDRVCLSLICHYHHFYDCLLSLHFKFNDFESAANLVLEMCRFGESHRLQKHGRDLEKSVLVPIGSHNLKAGLKLQIMPELLQRDTVFDWKVKPQFVNYKNGGLIVSNKTLAKLIIEFRRLGRTSELSKLLLQVQQDLASEEGFNLSSDVVNACICLGWLETAHDILDDMDAAGFTMGSAAYFSLLKAYYRQKMLREADALQKQMRKAGLLTDTTEDSVISSYHSKLVNESDSQESTPTTHDTDLIESLVRETKENNAISPSVFKLNSSIYFFCKAHMIEDALKAYKRMQQMGIQPNEQTFANLACGYASLQMYREITILWGDIKRSMQSRDLVLSRDLYEFLLLCFLQGGYFERVMEIVGHMEEQNMYTDKWMYKNEFLKLHKNLYRSLKPSETRTEAQKKRLEHVRAFKKWVGIG